MQVSQEPFPWPVRILGAASLTGGLWMMAHPLLTGKGSGDATPLMLFAYGPVLICLGLLLMDAHTLLGSRAPALNWRAFWGGLLTLVIGFFILVAACADPRDAAFHAPRWVVALVGVLLASVGALVLSSASSKAREGKPLSTFGAILVVLALTCAGAVFSYAAFGPGKREFEGEISIPFLAVPFEANEYVGRAVFGLAALVIDAFAITAWYGLAWGAWLAIKQRRSRKAEPET